MTSPEWLKVPDCAAELGVSPKAVFDWIHDGKIRAKSFGPRCTRIARSEWDRFKSAAPDTHTAPAA